MKDERGRMTLLLLCGRWPKQGWHRVILQRSTFILGCAVAATVGAQDYPARPVRMLLGITPGGGTDVVARAVAQKLTERWGRTFVVDNRPGANGVIAMTLVAQAIPDGYTLFVGTTDNVAIATPMKKVPFDTQKAYVPVAQMDTQPYLLTSNPSLPFSSIRN
jgi:tripartite-type tricarboxylate transporter receptor subunit TctC